MTDRIPLCLKFPDWPEVDRTAWANLFADGDLFDEFGPCLDWSEGTRKLRCQSYGQWLSFLRRTDQSSLCIAPDARVTIERVQDFIAEFHVRDSSPKTIQNHVLSLYAIAKAMAPERDWRWLNTAVKRLTNSANRHSLPPPHPITGPEILRWSLRFMAETAVHDKLSAKKRAIHFRRALMIGFLISCPVRRQTLLAMTVETHISPTPVGFMLRFTAEDMKDRKSRCYSLPVPLVSHMRVYLDLYRPVLLDGNETPALWVNQYGEGITPDGLARELPKNTERYLGVPLRPHAFRSIAATTIAECDPERANIIRDILGHSTLAMSERHYNRATGLSSCNKLQSIVEDIRLSVPIMGRAKSSLTVSERKV